MVTTNELRLYEVEAPQAKVVDTVQEFQTPKATSYKNSKNQEACYDGKVISKIDLESNYFVCKELLFNNSIIQGRDSKTSTDDYFKNYFKDYEEESKEEEFFVRSNNSNFKDFVRNNDWCIRLIEDIIIFYKGILPFVKKDGNIDWKSVRNIAILYWKARCNTSLLLCVLESDFVKQLETLFESIDSRCDSPEDFDENEANCDYAYSYSDVDSVNGDHVQGMDFDSILQKARDSLESYKDIKNSIFFKKIYKLIMYGMAHSLFDKIGLSMSFLGFSLFQQEAIKKKYHLGTDFIHVLLDSLLFLLEKGFQIIKTGNIDCMYHSSKTYVEFHNRANKIKRDYLFINNPEANGFDEHSFRRELDDLIDQGESMCKYANIEDSCERKLLNSYLHELLLIKATLNTKAAAREPRQVPFSILINGESGIAKSTIKEILFKHYAKVNNLESDSTYCYTRNPAAKYWDGFTTSQWCVVLDDVAFMHPNKATNGDPSVMEFIQVVNPTPFTPDQADLSDKGRTPLRAKLVIATTNTKHLNAHFYFSCASAVQRRFPYIITPEVKQEFCMSDSKMLDPTKLPVSFSGYPDIWNWTIEKVIPVSINSDKKCAEFKVIKDKVSLKEFLKWYNEAMSNFNRDQSQMMSSLESINNLKLCDSCHLSLDLCDCGSIQSATISIYRWLMIMYCYVVSCCLTNRYTWKLIYYFLSSDIYTVLCTHKMIRLFIFERMGYNAQKKIGYPIFFVTLSIMISAILVVYKTYNIFTVQGAEISTNERKPKGEDNIENVWYKNEFVLNPMDFSETSKSSKGIDRPHMEKLLNKSLVNMYSYINETTIRYGRLTCIKGQIYMTNNHIIPKIPVGETRKLYVKFDNSCNGVSENVMLTIDESLISRCEQSDVLIIRLPIPNRRGVYDYLPTQNIDFKDNGFYISRGEQGVIETKEVLKIHRGPRSVYDYEGIHYDYIPYVGKADSDTVDGFCGSLLISQTHYGYVILGMHVRLLFGTINIASVPVCKTLIDNLMLKYPPQFHEGYVSISAPSASREISTLHKKSPIRFIPNGTATVIGSFTGFRPHLKSRVEVTPMAYYLPDYKIKYGPPIMQGWEPWYKSAKDLTQPQNEFNPSVLKSVSESFLEDILQGLDKDDFSKVHKYDDFTSINGAARVRFVDKINRNTSAGLPWRKLKRNFMEPYEMEMFGLPDAVKVDKEIMDRVQNMVQNYLNGYTNHPVTCGNLKDEARSFAKIASCNTRLFNGAPFDFVILMRKYYLSVVRLIQTKQYLFEACPGLVAQSDEWDNLYHHLTKHGADRMIAGDFAAFDKNMISAFMLEAFHILIQICKRSGNYTDEDLKIMYGISYDISFPMIDLNGDLLRLWCSNPSGHPLTVIINCLVNSLYMRYAYYMSNPLHEAKTFKTNVVLATYGDDNVLNVSKNINWFNHTSIQNKLSEIGITYTMADKIQQSIPFIHMNDVTFLKRRWRYDEDVKKFLCPLEFDSIEKQLMVWTRSKNVSKEEQGIDIIQSVCREWWFYGKDKFNHNSLKMQQLVADLGWQLWIKESTFPTWEQLYSDYLANSKHIIIQSRSIKSNKKQNLKRIKERLDLKVNAIIAESEKEVLNRVPVGGTQSLTLSDEDCPYVFVDYQDECVLGEEFTYLWV